MNRRVIAWSAGVAAAFVAGLVLAHAADGGFSPHGPALRLPVIPVAEGGGWSLFGKPRAADAPRAGPQKPADFAIWKTRLDTRGPQPLACIEMSRPLDPGKAYGDFVLISPAPDHPPAVSVSGDSLCLGGVGLDKRRVTLLKGLPAKSGETLAANQDVDFTTGDKPPYVGFAGQGVILPREESDGVGIETVNVTRLAIEVWRVPDRNLVRVSVGGGDDSGEYGDGPDQEGRIVWKGLVTVRGDGAGRTTTVFPLGAVLKDMIPGGYVIKARDASGGAPPTSHGEDDEGDGGQVAQAQRWVIFTDMALTAYGGSRSLDLVARSLKTAKALPGLRLVLMAHDGETLATTRTDAQGHGAFARALLQGEGASKPRMVMAYGVQGDMAALDLERPPTDLSKQGVGGRDPQSAGDLISGRDQQGAVDGYLYADRGIYRPGERAHLTALVRDQQSLSVEDRAGYLLVKRPSGVEFKRYAFKSTAGGAVLADVDLPRSAPRGRWSAELHIDGLDDAVGAMPFSVEDFAPQRLAVAADAHPETPLRAGEARAVDVTARFLYGAIGAGLKTQGEARLKGDPNPFPKFADYRFGDETRPFAEKFLELGSTVTDGAGHARLTFAADAAGDTAAPLTAAVTASVFEPGGRPVRQGTTLKVRPRPLYLGMKVIEGEASQNRAPVVSIDIVALDATGARLTTGATWRIISENWDYDWFQQNGRWQWRRTHREVVVDTGTLVVSAGAPARLSRRLGWGDYRLELDGPGGARTVQRFSSGWGAAREDVEAPDFVRVSAPGPAHAQGDTVDIAIKAPYGGEAQVAVATDHVIDFKTQTVGPRGATLRLKTSAAWGGGAYVLVSVIQPRDPKTTPLPRRALGLVYVPLDPKSRRLDVDLATPDRLDSRAPVIVPVHVRGLAPGQKAYVTVAAVDEGILALTKFESPDPAKWFFGKRALTVEYRDDYGRLLDANLGAPANVNFGGDELGGEGLTTTPIKTVALWSGVVRTDASGRARIALPPGDFNGQLRVMAVAWTHAAVGASSRPMTVREPVVADLNLPRFLSPGDRPTGTLELHNLDGQPGSYLASLTATGGVLSGYRETVALAVGQRVARPVPFAAPDHTGVSRIGFTVAGPGFSTVKGYDLQTRLGWGAITRVTTSQQAPGEAFIPTADLLAGLAAGDVDLQVSYSPFQGFDPAAVALALSRYPYGCSEQTVSTAYALLWAAESGDGGRQIRGLNEAVGKLLDRQSLDGAFGLWRVGDGEADPWLGAYVTDFLVEARARGAAVPDTAFDRALAAMRQVSRPDGFSGVSYRMEYPPLWFLGDRGAARAATARMRSRASAYALYVLAKAGRGDLPRLRWWHDVQMKSEASPLAMAQVGAGLAFMGDQSRARSALQQASHALTFKDPLDEYQSPLRDLAGVIALAYEAGAPDIARQLQGRLAGAVRDPDSLNTQEQARLIQAAHFMLKASGAPRIEAVGVTALAPAGGAPRWAVGKLSQARFVNRGTGAIWRTVTVRGTPLRAPGASSEGLTLGKSYLTLSGAPADLSRIRQGDRIIVRLSGRSLQARTIMLAVDDALPAGFEIETVLGQNDAQDGPFKFLGKLTPPGVQESRDDRYVAAMTAPGRSEFAFAYVARAVTPGSFFLPGAQAIDMYHATVAARTAAGRLTVASAE